MNPPATPTAAATLDPPAPAVSRREVSPVDPSSQDAAARVSYGPIAALLVLAAGSRAWGLARFPFEQDELYTVLEARHLWAVQLEPGIAARPLYFLLQHALLWILPETEAALRLAPFAFGVLGVAATWALARRVLGEAPALAAAFLVAISPWHLHASGMARYWSLLYLLAALFFLAYFTARDDDRPRSWLLALGVLVAGLLTHPTFLFATLGAALGATLVDARGRPRWTWPTRRAWLFLWIPFALVLASARLALVMTGSGDAVRNWSGRGWSASARLVPAIVEWATPAVALAAAAGALLLLFARGEDAGARRWGAMAVGGTLCTLGALAAASMVTNVYADYAVGILPLAFVAAAAPARWLARGGVRAGPAAALVCVLVAGGVLPSTLSHLSDGTRFEYRPAFRHAAAAAPGAPVHVWPIILQRRYAPALHGRELAMDPRRLDAALAAERDLWVVTSVKRYGLVGDDSGAVAAWLDRRCVLAHRHEGARWDYRLYRVDLHRCTLP